MLPRELFTIGHFTIYTFGVTIAVGMLVGLYFAVYEAARKGINADAYGIARIGCDLYGKVANVPWAVWVDGQPHHPSQAYSALMGLVIFAILWARRSHIVFDGEQFTLFIGLYAVGRFIVEFSRYGPMVGPFTLTQIVTIPIGIAAFARLRLGRQAARLHAAKPMHS